MKETSDKQRQGAVQTTGHAWDGDLQEFNNPLPRWWLWGFYLTVIFAVVYWVFYPAWPIGGDYTKGVGNTITYTSNGKEVTTHWNTRALLHKELQQGDDAKRQQQYLAKVAGASYEQILGDAEMMAFTRSLAKGLFGDNCAGCHGTGGAGVIGLFPNLADDDWLWGGTTADIEQTLRHGRNGFMPAFRETFTDSQLDDVAQYVLSLSGSEGDAEAVARGSEIFNGETGGCYYCHTKDGTGMQSTGAANLTDSVWTVADVTGQADAAGKLAVVKQVIRGGIQRQMPAWQGRLTDADIKLLTVYVHELGGGK